MTTITGPSQAAPSTAAVPADQQAPILELRCVTERYGSVAVTRAIERDLIELPRDQ